MKTLKCDLCEYEAQGETFDAWMEAMKPHYGTAHADFMAEQGQKPKDEQMAEMQKWMTQNKTRFQAQVEDSAS